MNYNKTIFGGNITGDLVTTKVGDSSVTKFSVAFNPPPYKREDGTKVTPSATFLNVEAWGKLGTNTAEYMKKGYGVLVDGQLEQSRWEKDGVKHSRHFLRAESIQFGEAPKAKTEGATPAASETPTTAAPAAAKTDEENVPF